MWTLKDHAEGNTKEKNAELFSQKLLELQSVVPCLQAIEVGINNSELYPANYDVVLITEFATWQDLQDYAVHPEHVKVVEFAKKIVASRAAVDFEV